MPRNDFTCRLVRAFPSILPGLICGILLGGSAARATEISLSLVDQNGDSIAASQFWVGGQLVGQGATIDLPEGSHPVEIRAGLNGLASPWLRRSVEIDVGPLPETFVWTWKTAVWSSRIVDQNGLPITGSFMQPGWNGLGGSALAHLGNDEVVSLPVTEDDDPDAPAITGSFSDGYPVRLLVGINGQIGHRLRRNEPALEHGVAGTVRTFVWKTAPLTLEIVDQHGQPISSSIAQPGGPLAVFADLTDGATVIVPVTEDPDVPTIYSSFGDGYPVRLLPAINGVFAPQGGLRRDEPALEHGPGGTHRIFEWKTAPVTFELVDQRGLRIPVSQIDVGPAHHQIAATLNNGGTVVLPLTEDPDFPPIYNGFFADGYPVNLRPGIHGIQASLLLREEEGRELAGTEPQTWTYVWETTTCPLYVVSDDGRAIPDASIVQSPVLGTVASGSTVSLPITDPILYPTLGNPYADGYPDIFLQIDPVASLAGPFTFSFLSGETIDPDFVSAAGETVGLRCLADVIGNATLFVPAGIGAVAGAPVEVPIELDTGGDDVAAIAFSVDYGQDCLAFDSTDSEPDGIPDAIDLPLPSPFTGTVDVDLNDHDGEIDVTMFSIPVTSFPDGPVATITFQTTCTPPTGESLFAPVGFSQDPAATFGDSSGADVPGNTLDGEVEIVSGLRGDCNGNSVVTAADLSSLVLELFDDDGDHWLAVRGGSFAGDPVGCDANAEEVVDSGDLSCTGRILFGDNCVGGRSGMVSEGGPWLKVEARETVPETTVLVSVHFDSRGWEVNTAVFSLDLRTDVVFFDATDDDGDGIPDAVHFGDLPGMLRAASFDPSDDDGEIDVAIGDLSVSPGLIEDGLLLEIALELVSPGATPDGAAVFSREPWPSFGTPVGQGVPGDLLVFADGFESAGFEAWSHVVTP